MSQTPLQSSPSLEEQEEAMGLDPEAHQVTTAPSSSSRKPHWRQGKRKGKGPSMRGARNPPGMPPLLTE